MRRMFVTTLLSVAFGALPAAGDARIRRAPPAARPATTPASAPAPAAQPPMRDVTGTSERRFVPLTGATAAAPADARDIRPPYRGCCQGPEPFFVGGERALPTPTRVTLVGPGSVRVVESARAAVVRDGPDGPWREALEVPARDDEFLALLGAHPDARWVSATQPHDAATRDAEQAVRDELARDAAGPEAQYLARGGGTITTMRLPGSALVYVHTFVTGPETPARAHHVLRVVQGARTLARTTGARLWGQLAWGGRAWVVLLREDGTPVVFEPPARAPL